MVFGHEVKLDHVSNSSLDGWGSVGEHGRAVGLSTANSDLESAR